MSEQGAVRESGRATAARVPTAADLDRWRAHLQHEWSGAAVLRTLAADTRDPAHAAAFERLAARETRHAEYWQARLVAARASVPEPEPGLRDRLLLAQGRRLGERNVLELLAADALRTLDAYGNDPDAAVLVASERVVAREMARLAFGRGAPEAMGLGREHRRSTAASGSLRAAVFGVNDGLVSNLSLVMGVAGAAPDTHWILLTGVAGLLAGAFSMGGGELISMLAQRELLERELALEREEIRADPEGERANLARIYEEKGLDPVQADAVATQLMADPDVALDTIAREQLGLNPDELGSPRAAALASWVSFAVGAALPILPFLFLRGHLAITFSLALSTLGLFGVGALLSLFTARNPVTSGLRMLGIGLGAAAATYLIGRAIGVSIAG